LDLFIVAVMAWNQLPEDIHNMRVCLPVGCWSGTFCNVTVLFAAGKKDKTDTGFQEKNGIRCIRLNPDGTHIASGDRAGNVRCGLLLC